MLGKAYFLYISCRPDVNGGYILFNLSVVACLRTLIVNEYTYYFNSSPYKESYSYEADYHLTDTLLAQLLSLFRKSIFSLFLLCISFRHIVFLYLCFNNID